MKLVIGAGNTTYNGWVSTQADQLNLLIPDDFEHCLNGNPADAMLAEHVWEHMSLEDGTAAAKNCFEYLKPGGYLRCAVPDAFFRNEWYQNMVQVGGPGPVDHPAYTHKVLYNYRTFRQIFIDVGFEVELLEYCDDQGRFHYIYWNNLDGHISRSFRYDTRNTPHSLSMVSIIVDAKKPLII
ncbi:MAG: methyltransferase domain-containing protein [Oscillospiraceae bacterium]|jgi:predicted SAM-dependent methyltransferase|nr:methyltransferase domain-containing protein [Oscillospiraceae bacterium]